MARVSAFRRPPAQPPIKLVVQRAFFRDAAAGEAAVLAVDDEPDLVVLRDHRFQRQPPQLAEPVGEARGDVDRERHAGRLEDRIGESQRVAVAVVEREADEAPGEIAFRQAAVHFVEADEVEAGAAQQRDDAGQKPRRDLEQPIGLEAAGPRRADVVQGQNDADAADQWLQRRVGAGKIQRFKPAADDGLSEPGHR